MKKESTFNRLIKDPGFSQRFEEAYRQLKDEERLESKIKIPVEELLTSSAIPGRLGAWEPVELKKKKDKLYQKRLKQNPDLKKNIKKIGEQSMKTVVTFTSDNSSAISKQWHIIFHIDDKSWNSWDISDIKTQGGKHSFTLVSWQKDQRLNEKDLDKYLMAGVDMSISQTRNESKDEEESIRSVLELDLSPEQLADILLKDNPGREELEEASDKFSIKKGKGTGIIVHKSGTKFDVNVMDETGANAIVTLNFPEVQKLLTFLRSHFESFNEAEVPDDEDGESDTIDDVQTMLTKMLPKTKNLKLGADKEKELKTLIQKAMSMMGEQEGVKKSKESILDELAQIAQEDGEYDLEIRFGFRESVDSPQFQFAIMVPREDYQFAAKTLNDSNIKAKTQFHDGEMAVIGFDHHQETGHGAPEVTEEEVLGILNNVGIAAISATGMEFQEDPETLSVEDFPLDENVE